VVIMALIQPGGLGITTLSTALFLVFGQRASLSTHDMVESSFRARPEGRLKPLLAQVFVWTIAIEAVGAGILLPNHCRDRPHDLGGAHRPASSVAEDAMRSRGERIGAEVQNEHGGSQ
jgi:hypothetical protein